MDDDKTAAERTAPSWCPKCDSDDSTHHAPELEDYFCVECGVWLKEVRTMPPPRPGDSPETVNT